MATPEDGLSTPDETPEAKRRVQLGPSRPALSSLTRRRLFLVMGGGAATIVIIGVLLASGHEQTCKPKLVTLPPDDRGVTAALVQAASNVCFHPNTASGVGTIEPRPLPSPIPASDKDSLPAGSAAPPFSLRMPNGKSVMLSSEQGKAVLLELFATWCPHCAAEAPHLAKLYDGLPHSRYAFLSINADGETAPSVLAFHIYFELPYPALLDPNPSDPGSFSHEGSPGPVSKAYKLKLFPTFYVIDPQGRIAWAGTGEQPDALLRYELNRAAAA